MGLRYTLSLDIIEWPSLRLEMLKFAPSGCLLSWPCVSACTCTVSAWMCVLSVCTWVNCVFLRQPVCLGYHLSWANWCLRKWEKCLNSQSMTFIFQLNADLCRNPSKRQDFSVRTMTFIDPVFAKWIFGNDNIGWKLVGIDIRNTSGICLGRTCKSTQEWCCIFIFIHKSM